MKLNASLELQEALKVKINAATADQKTEVLLASISELIEAGTREIVAQYTADAVRAAEDKEFAQSIGLRILNKTEKAFYAKFGNAVNQAITLTQEDIIPTTIVDRTLEDVKTASKLLSYVRVAPAGLKKWISAAHSGAAAWGALTTAIAAELSATISSINFEAYRLAAYLLIPKGIVILGDAFVDRYLRAILQEALTDGLEKGVCDGTGKDQPIGFTKLLNTSVDGVHTAKTPEVILDFSPTQWGPILKTLTNDGQRALEKVLLVCNPTDYFGKIFPACKAFVNGVWVDSFPFPTEVIQTVNCTTPFAAIPDKYDLGIQAIQIDVFKETKALDDVDVLIAKTYGNGRPVDDKCAVALTVTNLVAYIPTVNTKVLV